MPEQEDKTTVEEAVQANTEAAENVENKDVAPEVEAVQEDAVEEVQKVNEPSLEGINEALAKIQETLEQSTAGEQQREAALSKVRETVEGVEAKVEKQLTDLLEKHEKLATEITAIKEGWNGVEKRLETIEGATALRKSNDVEDESVNLAKVNTGKKNVWVGSFLPSSFDQE